LSSQKAWIVTVCAGCSSSSPPASEPIVNGPAGTRSMSEGAGAEAGAGAGAGTGADADAGAGGAADAGTGAGAASLRVHATNASAAHGGVLEARFLTHGRVSPHGLAAHPMAGCSPLGLPNGFAPPPPRAKSPL
jgi:hypothetical protein